MEIKILEQDLTVCRIESLPGVDLHGELFFLARTDEELSLVCPTSMAPAQTMGREDEWRAMRIQGQLDFSLVGILSNIAGILAERGISIFAVSTYNTDYVLVKSDRLNEAVDALTQNGYEIIN